jgi:phosphoglycerate kinase
MCMNESDGASPPVFGVPTLAELEDLNGRSVLVRGDLDVAGLEAGSRSYERRVGVLVPTIRQLQAAGARVTVCGHCGELDGEGDDAAFSRVREELVAACPGVAVLPNLAGKRHEAGDDAVIQEITDGQDVFVNEAFQWCWLALASIVGPPKLLPAAAGLRLESDIRLLHPFVSEPRRPFVVVFGSHESLSRLPGLRGLILRADSVLVGGAMALPFLQATGTLPEEHGDTTFLRECRACFGLAREISHEVHLPSDLVWERPDGTVELVASSARVAGAVSDIGPKTRLRYAEILQGAGSVLWTGALGQAEDPRFTEGTQAVSRGLPAGGHVVLGGDALLAAVEDAGTMGAATGVLSATDSAVTLLKDGDLPGLAALRTGRSSPSP